MSFRDLRKSRATRQAARSFVRPQSQATISTTETADEQHIHEMDVDHPPEPSAPSGSLQPPAFGIDKPETQDGTAPELTDPVVQEKDASDIETTSMPAVCSAPGEEKAIPVQVSAGWYSQLPPFLSIKRTQETGRGLWTAATVPAGFSIFYNSETLASYMIYLLLRDRHPCLETAYPRAFAFPAFFILHGLLCARAKYRAKEVFKVQDGALLRDC